MFLFGHPGITLGISVLLSGALSRSCSISAEASSSRQHPAHSPELSSDHDCSSHDKPSWITSLAGYIDIRFLLIGSLLPDIIDKPVGRFFFAETFSNGQIFSHTLLFPILVTIAGLYLYRRRRKTWLFALSFGAFTHLVFDQMWRVPRTFFWPIFGFTFQRVGLAGWIPNLLRALLTEPAAYVPELLGVGVLIWFTLVLARRKKVSSFFKYGQVS